MKILLYILLLIFLLVISYISYFHYQKMEVEAKAEVCKSLQPEIEEYKDINNEYPSSLELFVAEYDRYDICNYQRDGDNYNFWLGGGPLLTLYIYCSKRNIWFWD